MNDEMTQREFTSGAKARVYAVLGGTTEVVPFPNPFGRKVLDAGMHVWPRYKQIGTLLCLSGCVPQGVNELLNLAAFPHELFGGFFG
jgi:hypothetical protein